MCYCVCWFIEKVLICSKDLLLACEVAVFLEIMRALIGILAYSSYSGFFIWSSYSNFVTLFVTFVDRFSYLFPIFIEPWKD